MEMRIRRFCCYKNRAERPLSTHVYSIYFTTKQKPLIHSFIHSFNNDFLPAMQGHRLGAKYGVVNSKDTQQGGVSISSCKCHNTAEYRVL